MTTWLEMTYGHEAWERKLKDAETYRKVRKLPRPEARLLLGRIVAFLGGKVAHKPVVLQEVKV